MSEFKEASTTKLVEVSERAKERVGGRDKGYTGVTVENAAARLASNLQKSRA
jgi:hypothetical protein